MNDTEFEIFPNPAGQELKIRSNGFEFDKIEIIDMSGNVLFSKKLKYVQNYHIPLALSDGTYILMVSNKSETVNKQFVVQN